MWNYKLNKSLFLFFLIVTILLTATYSYIVFIFNDILLDNLLKRHIVLFLLYVLLFLILFSFFNLRLSSFVKKNHPDKIKFLLFLCVAIGISASLLVLNFGSLSMNNYANYHSLSNLYGKSILTIISTCILFPILEEFLYRGVYCNLLYQSNKSVKKTIWFSAILFYISHINIGTGLYFPSIFILLSGVFLGYIYIKSNSLLPTILLHISYNSILMFGYKYIPIFMKEHGKPIGVDFKGYIYTSFTIPIFLICITISSIAFILIFKKMKNR